MHDLFKVMALESGGLTNWMGWDGLNEKLKLVLCDLINCFTHFYGDQGIKVPHVCLVHPIKIFFEQRYCNICKPSQSNKLFSFIFRDTQCTYEYVG